MKPRYPWNIVAAGLLGSLIAVAPALAEIAMSARRSGYDFMSPETRAMQDDDSANPGMLWVLDGEALWRTPAGVSGKSCADCHGDARTAMKSVAADYPRYVERLSRPVTLDQQINACRVERQQASRLAPEAHDLMALSAYVSRQSRGDQITTGGDARLAPAIERGKSIYVKRQGQLNLSCALCHDDNWGRKLAGSTIPQAQPNAYPIYRLEWQTMGSLQRRLRICMSGMRAEPYEYDAPEFVDLEVYMKAQARGMKVEAPGIRP